MDSSKFDIENVHIRQERAADFRKVEELTREAFWDVNVPGCDEHFLVHLIRDAKEFIPELDLVAENDGEIVGNIIYAHSRVIAADGTVFPVLTFGPLSVLPDYQKKGIGRRLIRYSVDRAKEMGFPAILIYGDPAYYSKIGFEAAEKFNIRNGHGMFAAALQAYELYPGALQGISGRFEEGEAYQMDPAQAVEFDKTFPFKETHETLSQSRFLEVIKMVHE